MPIGEWTGLINQLTDIEYESIMIGMRSFDEQIPYVIHFRY